MKNQQTRKSTHSMIQEQLGKHSISQRRRRDIKALVYVLGCLASLSTLLAVAPPPDGDYNTFLGELSGFSNDGDRNTAVGAFTLMNDNQGNDNTTVGESSLQLNYGGINNTAIGAHSMNNNSDGSSNTAIGSLALWNNASGDDNTAIGVEALEFNIADQITAVGRQALQENTIGNYNTAVGYQALWLNNVGRDNTAMGYQALKNNVDGVTNTAVGVGALANNTESANTAVGWNALIQNTTGNSNTAIGDEALLNNQTGSKNIAIGLDAGSNIVTGSNNISIGNDGGVAESGYIRIGTRNTQTNAFIAGIWGRMITNSAGVIVDIKGHLGTIVSSERYKAEIKAMDQASEAIFSLRPVTFHYKKELDPEGIPQFGLVAEQVEKINRDLVVRDDQGKPYTVRYDAVNAMLLNEFLKAHRKMEEQGAAIARQQKQIETLTASLQKVSVQLELRKSAPQPVANNQ